MKKIMFLTLALVFAFSAVAMAADVKVGGEVRYVFNLPADDFAYSQATQLRLKVTANINEDTFVQWYAKDSHVGSHSASVVVVEDDPATALVDETVTRTVDFPGGINFDTLYTTQIVTKVKGVGTIGAGILPDYGTNPFASLGGKVWGATGDETNGLSFASEKFSGISGQAFFAPKKDDSFIGGEVTYDLPMLEGSFVGFSANKKGEGDMAWALIGSAKVATFTVYGEVGKTGDVDDLDDKDFGVTTKFGDLSLTGELQLAEDANKTIVIASYPFKGVSLNGSYQFGDGYDQTNGSDGKIALWAKVSF